MNNGSGYRQHGMFFRNDGYIEIGGSMIKPDVALVRVFSVVPQEEWPEAIKLIKHHKRTHPIKKVTLR